MSGLSYPPLVYVYRERLVYMGYSDIVSIEIINFMVYKHAVVSFDDKNIVNIKGYNSGGKSTILKALAVCLMNMYPKAQTKFIRHGEKYFRIVVRFSDGVSILRDKYITGQSLYELYKDEKCVFTTKEGNKLTKVDAIPQTIQEYLGLCQVSTGCLNYQVRQDPLWLIETTGSENYNSLNEILKAEEISRANALLNSDKNKLNSEITTLEASLQETILSLTDASLYTDELLLKLEGRELLCKKLSSRYREVKGILDLVGKLDEIKELPSVEKVSSYDRYANICDIERTVTDIDGVVIYPSVSTCDIDRLVAIEGIQKGVESASSIEIFGAEVSTIDTNAVSDVLEMVVLLNKLSEVSSVISSYETQRVSATKELEAVVSEAAKRGIKYVRCSNCGSYVEVKEG